MRTTHLTAVVFLGALGAGLAAARSTAANEPVSGPAPLRVAVLDFTDAAPKGDLDSLGKGLQSMITTDLSESAAFMVVERERLRDVQTELKLQRRAEIDKATAVKIGKLAGATHLVSGSFTVVGDRMRIDCRMVAVATGDVLLAEKVDGDKAAFFDLEKTLMNKLVAAAGAKVAPKERARMARIHTADFDAFRKFSDGIGYFDEKRYDEATRALREATQIDAEFKLAHVTLAGYEELINNARAGAEAARASEDELKGLKRDKETKLGADIAERLQGLAKKGDKVDRLTAISILATTYRGEVWGPLKMLFERGDAFYLERLSDNYNKAYWSGVGELAQMPPMPWGGNLHLPANLEKFDADFAESRKDVQHGAEGQIADINYLFSGRHFARCLQADRRQEADVLERLYKLGLKQHPSADWKVKQQIELATEYRQVLDIDRSTAFLVQAQGLAKRSDDLTRIAELLEVNRAIDKAMSELGPKAELREYLQHYGPNANASLIEKTRKEFASGSLTPQIAGSLLGYRDWPRDEHEYLLIGDEPVWRLHGGGDLSTGPRLDALRAEEIRYWERPDLGKQESDTLMVMGATPVDRFTAMFELRGEPPQDWRLGESREFERWQKAAPADQRPEVGIVFGLRNIGVPSRGHNPPGPLAGYAVCVGEDTVRLVTIAGNARRGGAPTVTTVQAWKVDLGADKKLAVQVQVDGSAVKVTVGGKTFTANAPADRAGFLGLRIAGPGYGAIGGLRIARR